MEESMSLSDKAAEYFRAVLQRKSPNAPYPIVKLIGHKSQAPTDVCGIVRTCEDLKVFLEKYPDLFIVNGNSVKLNENNTVIEFYKSVLIKFSKYCPLSIEALFNHRGYASGNIKKAVNSLTSMKRLLDETPNVFTVFEKYVVLTESVGIVNDTISFYISILNSQNDKQFDLLALLEAQNQPVCVKLAVKDLSELKNLLACFTKTFELNYTCVTLIGQQSVITKRKQENKLGENMYVVEKSEHLNTKGSPMSFLNTSEIKSSYKETLKNGLNEIVLNVNERQVKAIDYISKVILQNKPFNVVPIAELYKYKFQAPPDIQIFFGKSPEELKEFLSRSMESFIVTGENVLSKINLPKKKWSPPYKGVEEPLCSILHNFFKSYTQDGKPKHIALLHSETGRCFLNNSGTKFFESPKDLAQFLEMFPESFYIFNDHMVNILNYDKEHVREVSRKQSRRKKESNAPKGILDSVSEAPKIILESANTWKEEVLSRMELINDFETCQLRAKEIYDNEKVIALDCEGLNLGADGILSLLQIGTENGMVYIFDLFSEREMLTSGYLRQICQSKNILKVIHDCRNDSANLFHEYNITLAHIFDTRIAHGLISGRHNKPIGFNDLCIIYKAPINAEKDDLKDIYKTRPAFWLDRPLTNTMLTYAALDVACLVPYVYENMTAKLSDSDLSKVLKLSERASKCAT